MNFVVADSAGYSVASRYPELLEPAYRVVVSLSDHRKISVEQKKSKRQRIRVKLSDKKDSQFQATARFETENDKDDSRSDEIDGAKASQSLDFSSNKMNIQSSQNDKFSKENHQIPQISGNAGENEREASGFGVPFQQQSSIQYDATFPSQYSVELSKGQRGVTDGDMMPELVGQRDDGRGNTRTAMAQQTTKQKPSTYSQPDRASLNSPQLELPGQRDAVPVADRDFSIASDSIQSSALKSSQILLDRGDKFLSSHKKTERQHGQEDDKQSLPLPSMTLKMQKSQDIKKVKIDEAGSSLKESDTPRGHQQAVTLQSDENAVKFSKKNTIRRFSTYKNEDNNAVALRKTKRNLPESDSDNAEVRKLKVKRGKTQKGDPSKAFPVESSENGITLCKISESCLEELSIVESEDLYASESPGPRQKEYDEKIQKRIQEGKQFMIEKQRNGRSKGKEAACNIQRETTKSITSDPNLQKRNVGTLNSRKREPMTESKQQSRKYQIIISKSNEPKNNMLEMNKNQGNTQQNVFFKQLNRNKNNRKAKAGPPSDFISIGSSSEVRQSQLGHKLGYREFEKLSLNSIAKKDKRDSSSYFGSNFSSHSNANSIKKQLQRDMIMKNRVRDTHERLQKIPVEFGSPSPPLSRPPKNASVSPSAMAKKAQSNEGAGQVAKQMHRRSKNIGGGSTATGGGSNRTRVQSLPPSKTSSLQPNSSTSTSGRSKLPGLRRTRDAFKKKGFAQKEQLAQVTEKEEYEYSPLKSGTAVVIENSGMDGTVEQWQDDRERERGVKDLDTEILSPDDFTGSTFDKQKRKTEGDVKGSRLGDFYLQKVQATDDIDSHQFEDSLLEQSSPVQDGKALADGEEQNSLNDTTTNIQMFAGSGSYQVQQVTLSSQDRKTAKNMPKMKQSKKNRKYLKQSNILKDGNYKNIREYSMFIPNQPNVSQVQGRTKILLAASEHRDQSVPRQTARKLAQQQQSDLVNMILAQDKGSFRIQMCNSVTDGGQSVGQRKLSPSDSKGERLTIRKTVNNINRSMIQPSKLDGSISELEITTDRKQQDALQFKKMLTQKTDASKDNTTRKVQSTLKKQNTHTMSRNEKYQNSFSKQRSKPKADLDTVDQGAKTDVQELNDDAFDGKTLPHQSMHKNAKSMAKEIGGSGSGKTKLNLKRSQCKLRVPSRTGDGWCQTGFPNSTGAPAVGDADADVDYLCNIAIVGPEMDQDNSQSTGKKESIPSQVHGGLEGISQKSQQMKFYPQSYAGNQQLYSSQQSQSKLNRKSVDSMSNSNIKTNGKVQDANLFFQGTLSGPSQSSNKQVLNQNSVQKSDLPHVGGKLNYSLPKRKKQKTVLNYNANAVFPGYMMPVIVNQGKNTKSPRGRNDRPAWPQKHIVSHTQKQANQSLFDIIQGISNSKQSGLVGKHDRSVTDKGNRSPNNAPPPLMYYNELFSGELRTRQIHGTKLSHKVGDAPRRRIGSYGQATGYTGDSVIRNKKSNDLKQQNVLIQPTWQYGGGGKSAGTTSTSERIQHQQTLHGSHYQQHAIGKGINQPQSRENSSIQGGGRQKHLQGDPYAIPLHYLRTGADPKKIAIQTHPRTTYKFLPKSIKGYGGSPFHMSGSNQMTSQSPDALGKKEKASPSLPNPSRLTSSQLESRDGSRASQGKGRSAAAKMVYQMQHEKKNKM